MRATWRKQIGADHHEVVLTADAFLDALPRLVWHEDEPLWGTASVALYFVSKLASAHVKVVLTGEGSDELFAGYDRYWMTALNAMPFRAYKVLPLAVRQLIRRGLLATSCRTGSVGAWATRSSATTRCRKGWCSTTGSACSRPIGKGGSPGRSCSRISRQVDAYEHHRRIFDDGQADDLVDQMLYTDIHTNLVELLMKQDQMSMATSIESRVPFLDHKLVEFAARVPSKFKIKGFSGKHLVKEALAGYLPDSILHRKKMGFPVPYEQWLQERFWSDVERTLLSEAAGDRGWFRVEAVRSLLDEHRAGRANHARQIWTLWGLELWARMFFEGQRPEDVAFVPDSKLAHSGAAN